MLLLFVLLIVGPIVASKFIDPQISIMNLQQPANWKNNDTMGSSQTGTALSGAAATSVSAGSRRGVAMFEYYTN